MAEGGREREVAAEVVQRLWRGRRGAARWARAARAALVESAEEAAEGAVSATVAARAATLARLQGVGDACALAAAAAAAERPTKASCAALVAALAAGEGRPSALDTARLLLAAEKFFAALPTVVDVDVRADGQLRVVGDTHGELEDLLEVLRRAGKITPKNRLIFNGDLVDRGPHGAEVALCVFALALAHPGDVLVARGNHEEWRMNLSGGFADEVLSKYDVRVLQLFHRVFAALPLAHVVAGHTLVLHGGLPRAPGFKLQDLRKIKRGTEAEATWTDEELEIVGDVMWSDPKEDLEGVMPSRRGRGVLFGPNHTVDFLRRNKLKRLVRSHQCVPEGVDVKHDGCTYTVFSASDYCGVTGNAGAMLSLARERSTVPTAERWLPEDLPPLSGAVEATTPRSKKKKVDSSVMLGRVLSSAIVEHREELRARWSARADSECAVPLGEWACGLRDVLGLDAPYQRMRQNLVTIEYILLDDEMTNPRVLFNEWLDAFEDAADEGLATEVMTRVVGALAMAKMRDKLAFGKLDANRNRKITAEEFHGAVRELVPDAVVLTDAQIKAAFAAVDGNGDGTVSEEEFQNAVSAASARSHRTLLTWEYLKPKDAPLSPRAHAAKSTFKGGDGEAQPGCCGFLCGPKRPKECTGSGLEPHLR